MLKVVNRSFPLRFLRDNGIEPLRKLIGSVITVMFQQVIESYDLDNDRDFLAGEDGELDVRNTHSQNGFKILVEPRSSVFEVILPLLQFHDYLDTFLEPDRPDSEN